MSRKSSISIVLCFIAFLLIYATTSRANLQLTDEAAVFASGINLATRGSIDIDSLRWLQERENLGHEGAGGHLYTKYFPGNILGTALIYWLAQQPDDQPYISSGYTLNPDPHIFADSDFGARLALRLNAVLGAVGVTAMYLILLKRFDWKTATITLLLFGLCTTWWYESRGLFSEIGAGTFLILSLAFAELGKPSLSALSLGVSLLFRPTNLLGIPIWLYGVWKKGWTFLWSGIFIALGLGGLLLYNWIRFQSLVDFGYVNEGFRGHLIEGLVGILFSPGRSVFFYSPILILCISGARIFLRYDRAFATSVLTVIASYVLSASMWYSWEGGVTWGSRLITPILPLLGLLLAPMVQKALSLEPEKTRFYIGLLAMLGFGFELLTITHNPMYVFIYYTSVEKISYTETINSFQNSWLSLQIRYLQHWGICNIDSYTVRKLLLQCP